MHVLILAGGLGSRLKKVVSDRPKPMAQILHRPFLEYLMDYWIQLGAETFYLSVCHLAAKIKEHFQNEYKGHPIIYFEEPKPLGTGGGLFYCLERIPFKKQEIAVINGDTFFEIDFHSILAFHEEKKAAVTLVLRKVSFNDRYSGVVLNEEKRIAEFCQRSSKSPELLINGGIYYGKPEAFLAHPYPKNQPFSLEDDFFPTFIHTHPVYGYVDAGRFIDIGIPSDYQKSQSFFEHAEQKNISL